MGSARGGFTRFISSTTTQWPEDVYGVVFTYKQYLRPKNGVLQKNSSAQSEPSCLANRLTCLQAMSMEQLGDVAPVTISVLLMKALLIVPCQRHLAQHHCGDQVRFQIAGPARVRPVLERSTPRRFLHPTKTLGLRPTDQSCHHERWLHLDFVDWRSSQSHHGEPDRRILL